MAREGQTVPERLLDRGSSCLSPRGKSGNPPTRLFLSSHSSCRLEQFSKVGINPCNVLLLKNRVWRRCNWPRDAGICPLNLFVARDRCLRNVRFPSDGDIWPTKPLFPRSRLVTRLPVVLHVTPSQLQKWVMSFQEANACCGSKLIAFLNSSNDNRSVNLVCRSDAADHSMHAVSHEHQQKPSMCSSLHGDKQSGEKFRSEEVQRFQLSVLLHARSWRWTPIATKVLTMIVETLNTSEINFRKS